MANKIRLTVGGIEYMVVSEENEALVRKVGEDLNAKLESMKGQSNFMSTTMTAVMAALDYGEQLEKSRRECEDLRRQVQQAEEAAACARMDAEEATREIRRLSDELVSLRQQN